MLVLFSQYIKVIGDYFCHFFNSFNISVLATVSRDQALRPFPHRDTAGEFKKWGKIPLKLAVFLFQWEYRPPFVLGKDRTSLRKSNSPAVSIGIKLR
jgi:hypothetical protein